MPKFIKMINNYLPEDDDSLPMRTGEHSPYYKKRITGFKKQNKIYPENYNPMTEKKEISLLREELKYTHKAYLSKIKSLSDRSDYMESRYNNLFLKFSEYRKSSHEKEEKIIEDLLESEEEAEKYFMDLMDERVKKTEWIGRTLKYQYLFEQMKKIGLQQSEDIFDCFEDIEVPEVSVTLKNKFVPTYLTDNVDFPDEDEDWSEDEDIIGESNIEPIPEGIPPERVPEGMPPEQIERRYFLPPIGWEGSFIRSESDGHYALLNGEWVRCENVGDHHHEAVIKIQKIFRGYISRIKNQE